MAIRRSAKLELVLAHVLQKLVDGLDSLPLDVGALALDLDVVQGVGGSTGQVREKLTF